MKSKIHTLNVNIYQFFHKIVLKYFLCNITVKKYFASAQSVARHGMTFTSACWRTFCLLTGKNSCQLFTGLRANSLESHHRYWLTSLSGLHVGITFMSARWLDFRLCSLTALCSYSLAVPFITRKIFEETMVLVTQNWAKVINITNFLMPLNGLVIGVIVWIHQFLTMH